MPDILNEFMNMTVGTEDYDYVVASDTDSVYLRLGLLVDKVCRDKSKSEVVEFLNKASEEIILPSIKMKYDELDCKMNAYENKMVITKPYPSQETTTLYFPSQRTFVST